MEEQGETMKAPQLLSGAKPVEMTQKLINLE